MFFKRRYVFVRELEALLHRTVVMLPVFTERFGGE